MAYHITKEELLEAIQGSNGVTTNVQQKLSKARGHKICWDTVQKHIDKWQETKTAMQNEKEIVLDFAEHNIIRDIIERHDVGTSKWYLRMKGKERGYEDSASLQLQNADPLNINLTGDSMTAEENVAAGNVEVPDYGDEAGEAE